MMTNTVGMVLAAGHGKRLQPLTLLRSKPAVPFLNRPFIHYALELLERCHVQEIVVNLHHLPETVREATGHWKNLITFSMENPILGTAGALAKVRDRLEGKTVVLINGKIYFEQELAEVLRFHHQSGALVTLVLVPFQEGDLFAPVYLDENRRITGFGRTPAGPGSATPGKDAEANRFVFTGVHVLSPEVLSFISDGVSDTVLDVYPALIRQGLPVCGFVSSAYWCECSTPRRYLDKSMQVLKRRGVSHILDSPPPPAYIRHVIAGDKFRAPRSASLENCILWGEVEVQRNSSLSGVIITGGVRRLPPETHLRNAIVTGLSSDTERHAVSRGWIRDELVIWPLDPMRARPERFDS